MTTVWRQFAAIPHIGKARYLNFFWKTDGERFDVMLRTEGRVLRGNYGSIGRAKRMLVERLERARKT